MRVVRGRRRRLDPDSIRLPLIALIDVVLFLLFYFVIAASFTGEENELATTLARESAVADGRGEAEPAVLVDIGWADEEARFSVDGRPIGARADLVETLRSIRGERTDRTIIVRADPNAPIEATAAAIQLAREAGFVEIGFALAPTSAASPIPAPIEAPR